MLIKPNYPHLGNIHGAAHPELTSELSTFDLRSGLIVAPFSYKQCSCSSNNQNGNHEDDNNNNNKRIPPTNGGVCPCVVRRLLSDEEEDDDDKNY